ncbi:uncharacterized protein LOC100254752 [Vitis vinifera]|uniref:Uncharacterized protein n=1 Tax=Vitis vinifera TaxID=29760 RepID=F6HUA8_VITVI|nr:uncharacterized protein LOC100254752 [Vitis vinifera]|eukprot:XP_002277018.1 PREDICTED: uncharacterized protein LOC100254752 [Vitis vinifera]
MLPGQNKPGHEGEKQKQFDREIRDMISALTNRLSDLQQVQKQGSSQQDDEDDRGVRIITLAGSNTGATMRGELDEKPGHPGLSVGENEALNTYVNSNFQSVNNSIMMGGSYSTNDPGVHMDISDLVEHHGHKPVKHGKKGKKKDLVTPQDDYHSEHSD